jgi:hypothetical protein
MLAGDIQRNDSIRPGGDSGRGLAREQMAGAAYPSDVAVGGRGEDVNRRVRAIRYIVELRQWVEITGIVGLEHAADVVVQAWGTAIVLKNLLPELANQGPAAIALIDKFRLGRAKCCFAWMFPPKIIH